MGRAFGVRLTRITEPPFWLYVRITGGTFKISRLGLHTRPSGQDLRAGTPGVSFFKAPHVIPVLNQD